MIVALVVVGLGLIGAAVVGRRLSAAAGSPFLRIALFGFGAALLLAAGTSAFLSRLQAPAQPTAAAQAAPAARLPRVMVVGDDGPEGTIRRADPVFEAALAAFEAELRRAGFAVADGHAVSTVNEALERARRSDTELMDLARRQQREALDEVVLFSLFVRLEFAINAQTLSGRGTATVLRAADASKIGVFEAITPTRWPLPIDCARTCQVQTSGVEAPLVAQDLAGQVVTAVENLR